MREARTSDFEAERAPAAACGRGQTTSHATATLGACTREVIRQTPTQTLPRVQGIRQERQNGQAPEVRSGRQGGRRGDRFFGDCFVVLNFFCGFLFLWWWDQASVVRPSL